MNIALVPARGDEGNFQIVARPDQPSHDAGMPLVLQPVALAGDLHDGRAWYRMRSSIAAVTTASPTKVASQLLNARLEVNRRG
jgi:hypothetical protein